MVTKKTKTKTSKPNATPSPEAKPEVKPKKRKNYITNKVLLPEVIECKKTGVMSDKLARMLQLITTRYATHPKFAGYTFNEDMQAYAMMQLCRTWAAFDEKKSSQAFSYYTQCITNSFWQFYNREKTQRMVRDALLIKGGLNPSYNYVSNTLGSDQYEDVQSSDNDTND